MNIAPLALQGPIIIFTDFERTSFATIGSLFRQSFEAIGKEVDERATPTTSKARKASDLKGRLIFHNTIGPNFAPIAGAYNIALPAHEWSKYPSPWVDKLNQFEEVWVTTSYVYNLLKKSGVKTVLLYMPPALNLEEIPVKTGYKPEKPFRFFSCGEAHFRKGFHLLMNGFTLAFPEVGKARLTIKTSPGCQWKAPREDITFITQKVARGKMLAMYKEHDAYITASLAEGLGLPVAEAILSRTPVMANYWGGHTNLLKNGAFWRIDHLLVEQPYCSDPSYYAPGQKCALSSPKIIANAMREIYKAAGNEKKQRATQAHSYLLENYGIETVAQRLEERFAV